MVGSSFWMNDSNVEAPTRSPAAAKSVPVVLLRSSLTAPAIDAAPAAALPGSSTRRPWKSLVARICTVSTTGSGMLTPVSMPMISGLWSELRNG